MCVAEDVCDQSGRVLIARGQRLGPSHLARLTKFGIQALFIDPVRGEQPTAAPKSKLRLRCEEVFSAVRPRFPGEEGPRSAPDPGAVRAAADALVKLLIGTQNAVLTLSGGAEGDDKPARHAINVAALAVAVGIDLRLPGATVRDIGSSMLLHDVGLLMLAADIAQRALPPGPQEVKELMRHPVLGYEYVLKTRTLSPAAAELVLSHHERLDGSGYPQGLTENQIKLSMRIVAAAEVFDSLISGRYGIPAVLPDAAIAWMLRNSGKLFDRQVVVALASRIAIYPDGAAVRLTTGETGIVAGTLPCAPRRPIVLIQADKKGQKLPHPMIVDLTRETGRAIALAAPTMEILNLHREKGVPIASIDPVFSGIG